jgi:hypothetical protein
MLTKNEVTALNLSPTKKDFVQIWNELLEVAGKLSERWDPTSTNESDPGIVLLKALTGIADKLNYNIDKNILEAFMPTAAQEDSMRKLCEMLGYSMKYYQSAVTEITIKYHNNEAKEEEDAVMKEGLYIPKFVVVMNGDQDINYFTINQTPLYISKESPTVKLMCMEGQLVKCESTNDNNVITINQINENNRFYLPETQIAENGIFIYNVFGGDGGVLEDGTPWEAVSNLNTQARGTRAFKFGFDSYEGRPYVEFPDDYSDLFNDGLFIYYARTSGVNGNISPRTLTQLELPTSGSWSSVSAESFSVENTNAATYGANAETIKQAYMNFKKTIGTFETLVTCRDYMNKIYSLVKANGKPIVSNILVTDIRNDLNRAVTICSCDNAGIFYKEAPLTTGKTMLNSKTSVGTITQVSDPVYSDLELVSESVDLDNVEVLSDVVAPIQGDVIEEEKTYIASAANKPFFGNPAHMSAGDWATGAYITRGTSWHLGSETGMPIFNDEYSYDLVDDEAFRTNTTGIVSEFNADGSRSSYWLITQETEAGETVTYTTELPIEWIETAVIKKVAQERTITQQVTKTANYEQTKTVNNLRVDTIEDEIGIEEAIDHFDLVFYPFKSYSQIKNDVKTAYDASFTYAGNNTLTDIKTALEASNTKTIAHNIKSPEDGHVISINNYLRLTATIATNSKVSIEEGNLIISNIKTALANAFNMRELDFGEEIPFDSIVETIENADARIKVASLNEPALFTTFSVLTGKNSGAPKVIEYAVASDWLDLETAESLGRFTKTDIEGNTVSTFDTVEARKIYNKLAVRNVLAGRVPLFDYNTTFKTGFTDGPYRVTNKVSDISKLPSGLIKPTAGNPYVIFADDEDVYTSKWEALNYKPDLLDEPTAATPYVEAIEDDVIYTGALEGLEPSYSKITYTKTYTPEALKGNVIAGNTTPSGQPLDYITNLKANCVLPADDNNIISDVTLAQGEFVKFRAPNFTTTKTYPAYVNYHLSLAGDKLLSSTAKAAEAKSLFEILDSDRTKASFDGYSPNWQEVLNYFERLDSASGTSYKKTFSIQQTISAYIPADENNTEDSISTGEIIVSVDNTSEELQEYTVESLMALSGCVKLVNEDFKAKLTWVGENAPAGEVPLTIKLDFSNPFITNVSVLAAVKDAVQNTLDLYRGSTNAQGNPVLPTQCAWTVSFDFECVPFEAKSLTAWEEFIRLRATKLANSFIPAEENGTIFWRKFGEGYDIGKYITDDTAKLLKFGVNYFGLLPDVRLQGVYIAKELGADAAPSIIKNGEEYQLRQGEHLYIEYTPSTTTEDGTTKTQATVTEKYGAGAIFKPSGFETGIMDSATYMNLGNTYAKTVSFESDSGGALQIGMHSLGANEQIEMREPAKVELTRESLAGGFSANTSAKIYVYKNFNDCRALEQLEEAVDDSGNRSRVNNSYILKDGEYIFYTDQNKSELAYFTSGTRIVLHGKVTLPQCDVIELSDIFEEGIQAIPWTMLTFDTASDKLEFQEYQYITLSADDTLKGLVLVEPEKNCVDATWKTCSEVEYVFADDPSTTKVLPSINLSSNNAGSGWEVSSIAELSASPNYAQTLRSTPKVQTSLEYTRTSAIGGGNQTEIINPSDYTENSELSFKANLACLACGDEISISDALVNPDRLKSFELRIFSSDKPAIVQTAAGKSIPYKGNTAVDLENWRGTEVSTAKYQELWTSVNLDSIKAAADDKVETDSALQLSINLLPNTYGVFCVYLDYKTDIDNKTWIEVLPGTKRSDITLLNTAEVAWESGSVMDSVPDKLLLNPGINCIRINKSGKIYIKTAAGATGTLMFDELRLVNSHVIKYTDKAGDTVTRYTQGLNLKQLGYLDASGTEEAILNKAARDDLKATYVEETFTAMEEEKEAAAADFTTKRAELVSQLAKVHTLVAAETAVSRELEALKLLVGTDYNRLTLLIDTYNKVNTTLTNETALLKALNNSNTESLEQQLAALLESFAIDNVTKQQILDTWAELRTDAQENLSKLTAEEVLADFNQSAPESTVKAFTEVKNAVIKMVQEYYSAQLAELTADLEQAVDSGDGARLLTLLRSLQAADNARAWAELATKINELSGIISTNVDDLIADIVLTATSTNPDYAMLSSLLVQLRNILDSNTIQVLTAEIKQAVDTSNSEQLKKLIEPLFKDGSINLSALGLDTTADNAVLKLVDTAYKAVQDKLASATTETTVITAINNLKEAVSSDYLSKLTAAFTDIKSIMSTLNVDSNTAELTGISKVIESLEDSTDNQVATIVAQLNQVIDTRKRFIDGYDTAPGLNTFTDFTDWTKNTCAEFIEEAVKTLWPGWIARRTASILKTIDAMFKSAFAGEQPFDTCANELSQKVLNIDTNKQLTPTLLEILNPDATIELFAKIETVLSSDGQKAANAALVRDIGALMPVSEDLAEAITANTNGNAVISKLLEDYTSATDVIQKQLILAALRAELDAAIRTDTQLLSIVSMLLCPSITKVETEIGNLKDTFFEVLLEELSSIKTKLLRKLVIELSITIDNTTLELLQTPDSRFDAALINFTVPNAAKSLLPADFLAALTTLKESQTARFKLRDDITKLRSTQLYNGKALAELTSTELGDMSKTADYKALSPVIRAILGVLRHKIERRIEQQELVDDEYLEVYKLLRLEEQLLSDIRAQDVNRDFYYNVPIENSLAIDFNEANKELNTLMNPAMNYDINNINNSFVISKLDIDYLANGLKIARSSRHS